MFFYVLENVILEKEVCACLLRFSSSGFKELILQTLLARSYTGQVGPPLLHILGRGPEFAFMF